MNSTYSASSKENDKRDPRRPCLNSPPSVHGADEDSSGDGGEELVYLPRSAGSTPKPGDEYRRNTLSWHDGAGTREQVTDAPPRAKFSRAKRRKYRQPPHHLVGPERRLDRQLDVVPGVCPLPDISSAHRACEIRAERHEEALARHEKPPNFQPELGKYPERYENVTSSSSPGLMHSPLRHEFPSLHKSQGVTLLTEEEDLSGE